MGRLGLCLLLGWLVAGCSNPGENVRVRLCKDLARGLLDDPVSLVWRDARIEMRRSEHLIVDLGFEVADPASGRVEPMRAACYYRYDAVDETALTMADPTSAYSTSPYSLTLNDQVITNPRLAQAIKQAMLKQGGELLDSVQRGLQKAAQGVQDHLGGAPQR
ncbi:hypothetical protein CKO23_01290 [Thiocystis violacea]|nr:hypothetical protein [Thiocystis violacea]